MNREKQQDTIFIVTIILMSIYLLWRMFFTLPWDQGTLNIIFGILLFIAEAITILTTFELFFQKMQKKRMQLNMPQISKEDYPHVDVFIATHNEPVDLLYKTVNACKYMDYPDKSKVHIYICDDGGRAEVEELAAQFGVGYLGFPGNKEAKSGNLNNALSKSNSPLIATFDADMIPQHTFLMKTVPYFLYSEYIEVDGKWRRRTDEERDEEFKLGLVQTPQSFYNPDLFQFNLYAENGIPNEQDFFSREVNILRNATNAVAYTGSNTVISRQAMIDIGCFPLKTITEDFETSIRLQQEGYITYATDEIQAAGLTTTTIKSMIRQRIRWGRGVIQSLQNTKAIFSKKLPFWTRITYLTSFLYWWSFFFRLIFILSPILFALFDFKIVNATIWEIAIFWLPSYSIYSIAMGYLSSNIRNQRWSQIIDTIFMPYLIIPVLLETLFIHERKFKVTSKKKGADHAWRTKLLYSIPHLLLLVLSVLAIVKFVDGKYGIALMYSSVIIFWLIFNLTSICYALFFMLGRRAYRNTERIRATEQVTIYANEGRLEYRGQTVDVSENGISIFMESAVYMPLQSEIHLIVQTARYQAHLNAVIVYVRKDGAGWRYSAKVEPVSEKDRREYMQIIYDRKHSLPEQLDLWDTTYDDIIRNIKKRVYQPPQHKRKSPRIELYYPVEFTNGMKCILRSFNYTFFSASNLEGLIVSGDQLVFYTSTNIKVVLQFTGKRTANRQEFLLKFENIDELVEQGLLEKVLAEVLNTSAESEEIGSSIKSNAITRQPVISPAEHGIEFNEVAAATEPLADSGQTASLDSDVISLLHRSELDCWLKFTNNSGCRLTGFNSFYFTADFVYGNTNSDDKYIFFTSSQIEVVLRYGGINKVKPKEFIFLIDNIDNLTAQGLVDKLMADMQDASVIYTPEYVQVDLKQDDLKQDEIAKTKTTRRERYARNK